MQTYVPTVFQDLSNPLLSQVAVFAKSLDYIDQRAQAQKEATNEAQTLGS